LRLEQLEDRTLLSSTISINDLSVLGGNLGQTITGTLNPGTDTNTYRFSGYSGERLNFTWLSGSGSGSWSVAGPSNATLGSNSFGNNIQVTLPNDGLYNLLLVGNQANPINYRFQVQDNSDAAVAVTGFGTIQSGSLAASSATTFTYTAPAGRLIYFDSLNNSSFLNYTLTGPGNTTVLSSVSYVDSGPVVLPRSGTYTLTLRNDSGSSQNYRFRLLDLQGNDATPITLGTTVSATSSGSLSADVYRFTASAGQRLYYDGLSDSSFGNESARLVGPGGVRQVFSTAARNDAGPFTLTEPGTYYLIESNNLASTPTYSFRVLDVAAQPALNLNTIVSGTLNPGTRTDLYRYTGTAGQRLFFNWQSTADFSSIYYLYGPGNQVIGASYTYLGLPLDVTLPSDGPYTLALIGGNSSPVAYNFKVATPPTNSTALTLGNTVSSTLTDAGQIDSYTFNGSAGQRLYFDGLSAASGLRATLVSPTGVITGINTSAGTDAGPFTLTEAGVYTLRIYGSGASTGAYSFRLLDVSSQPVLDLQGTSTSGTLNPGTRTDLYRFTGTAGQRLFFNWQSGPTGNGYYYLFGPNNQTIGFNSFGSPLDATMPVDGPYTLALIGVNGSVTVAYNFRVSTPPTSVMALTLGNTVSSTLSAGQIDSYTFTGTAGQRLYFDGLSGPSQMYAALTSPTGVLTGVPTNTYVGSDAGPFTLTETGTYTLRINAAGAITGTYSFRLLDVTSQPVLDLQGAPTSGTLNPGTRTDLYRFAGSAGQRLFFNWQSGSTTNGYYYLFGPANQIVGGLNYFGNPLEINLPVDGPYTLALIGNTAAGTVAYDLQATMPPTNTTALTLDNTVSSTLTAAGQIDYYTFTGAIGQQLFFNGLSGASGLSATLTSPTNVTLINGIAVGSNNGPLTLTEAGTYTLRIRGSAAATGAYSFRLLDLADQPALTLGSPTSGTLNPGNRSDIFRLDGTAGQRLLFTWVSGSGGSYVLYGLSNRIVGSASFGGNFQITLPSDGPYVLVLTGSGSSAVAYRFQAVDNSDNPVDVTGFGTIQSGSLAAGGTVTFTYTAPAGRLVYFDSLNNTSSLNYTLTSPDNTTVLSSFSYLDGGPVVLPRSGMYTLTLRNPSSGSQNYRFRLLDLQGDGATALTLGATVTTTSSGGLTADVYRFTGSVGQRLFYDGLSDTSFGNVTATLVGPGGVQQFFSTSASADRGPLTLTETGTYYLIESNNLTSTPTYSFRMLDVAAQSTLSLNTTVSGSLNPGTSAVIYRYTGTAGQRLYFNWLSGTGSNWALYGPTNQLISSVFSGNDFQVTLPADGPYTLVLAGYSSTATAYSFKVLTPATNTAALTLGDTISGTLTVSGQIDNYTFTGSSGQQLRFDGLSGAPGLIATLTSPSGTTIGINTYVGYDAGPFTLTEAGIYTLHVSGSGGVYTGAYSFRLLDAGSQPTLNLNAPVSGTLSPGTSTDIYRYTGTAGQRLYFKWLSGSGGGWALFGPTNQLIGTSGFGGDFLAVLPTDGTYTLVVAGGSSTPIGYSFTVLTPTIRTTTLTIGDTVNSTLTVSGELDNYTFTGNAGQQLYFDGLPSTFGLYVTLTSPSGVAVGINGIPVGSDSSLFTLPESGTYTLTVVGSGATTGAYSFRLLDAGIQPVLNLNTTVTGTLNPGSSTDIYRYTGTAGQRLYFNWLSGSGGSWSLYGPTSQYISSNSFGSDFQVTLPTDGAYTLVVAGSNSIPTPYSFTVLTPATTTNSLTLGSVISDTLAGRGQVNKYTFTGSAGQQLYMGVLAGTFGFFATLTSPSGIVGGINGFINQGPFTLAETGTYTLTISGGIGVTGTYAFRLVDLATRPEILVGAVFTVSLSEPSSSPVSVDYATADNTAIAGTDYVASSGTVVFSPGETAKPVKIFILPNPNLTGNVTFFVNLSNPVNATIDRGQGTATIISPTPVATSLQFVQQPTNTVAGAAFSPAVTVQILDQFNHVLTTSNANVSLALGFNPGGSTLGGTLTVAAVNGIATFSNVFLNRVGNGYTLTASSGGLTGDTSSLFNITPAAASGLRFVQQPAQTLAGQVISPPVTVRIVDAFGNFVPTANNSVTVAIGNNPGGGTLGGTTTVTAVNGVATFNNLTVDRSGFGYTLTAASNGLTGTASNPFNITAVPVALRFLQQPSTTVAGLVISPAVKVQIVDAFGTVVLTSSANVTLALGANPGGATLSGTLTVAAVNGVATFTNLSLNRTGTGYTLTASSGSLTGATSNTFDITPAVASHLRFDVQPTNAAAGAPLSPAVTVQILDTLGNVVTTSSANVTVSLGFNPGGSTLGGTLTVAADHGVATFSNLTLNHVGNGYTLTATSPNLSAAFSNPFNVTPAAASALQFGQQPTLTTAGHVISPAVTVQVIDAFGNLVPTSTATVTLAVGTNPGGGTLGGTTTVTAVAGIATFSDLTLDKAGEGYTLTASSTGLTAGTSAPFSIIPGAASAVQFGQQPTSVVAGQVISPAVTVRIVDALGNLVPSATNTVMLSLGNNPGGSTLGGTLTKAAVNGIATFSDLTLNRSGLGYTLLASSTGLTGGTSAGFTVTPAVPSMLDFGQQPSNVVVGQAISPAVTVRILDVFGNLVTSASNTVTMALGANPGGATLGGTLMAAAINGVATFSDLTLDRPGTGYTLVASSGSLTAATSNAFNVTAAAATAVQFLQQPTNVVAGQAISPAVTVRIVDAQGNLVPTATNTVTISLGANPGGSTLSGTLTVAAINGIATFSTLSLNHSGSGYTLVATSSGLTGATSSTFDVNAAAATATDFLQQPGNGVAGQAISPAVTVRILDVFGNVVTTSSATVTLTLGANPGGATLGGTTSVAAVNGIATFSNLTLNKAGTGYTLVAASTGLTSATSSTFNIIPATASAVQFGQQPTDVVAGQVISPAVTVRIVDAFGNLVTSAANTVSLTLGANPGGATLGGTTSVAAVNGVATFSNLTLDRTGTGYTLVASSTSLTAATSNSFNVTPASATAVQFGQQPTNVVAGQAVSPAVTVRIVDAQGNLVTTANNTVTLTLGANPGGSTLGGTLTVAAVNGIATFGDLTLNKVGTGYTLVANSSGLTNATSATFDVAAAAASAVQFGQQPSNAVAGQAINPAITVRIVDAFGNFVVTATNPVTLTIGSNPGGSTLSGTTTVAAVNGVATFSDLSLNRSGTGYTLVAGSNGLTSATSNTFDVTAAAASMLQYGQQPSDAVAGQAISPAVTVRILDAFGNLVTTSTAAVVIALGANPGGSTLGGTTTSNAVGGIATFNDLTLNRTGAGYTLVISSTGLTGITSNTFNVIPGVASALQFGQQPTDAAVGQAISPPVTVRIVDNQGNLVPTATKTVTVALGVNPGGATLGGTLTVAAINGIATFSNLTLDKAGVGYTLVANSGSLMAVTSNTFNITSTTAASAVQFGQQPSNVVAGQAISPAVTVRIVDGQGNLVPTATNTVTISLGTNPGGTTLGGTLTVAAVNGIATFSDLTLNRTGAGYTLVASSTGLTAATSNAFNVTPGVATALDFLQQPSSIAAGGTISPAMTVRIVDALGNVVPTANNTVSLTIGNNPGGSTLSGTTTVTAVSGIAIFSNISLNRAGMNYTLVASGSGLTSATSAPFNVAAGVASMVQFVQSPTNTVAGQVIAPPVTVQITDAQGNRITSANNTVTLALGANPGGSTLGGTLTVAAVNGIAVFSDLSLDKVGTGYTLVASSTGLTAATSSVFNITPANASALQFVQPPSNVVAGQAISPAVTVQIVDALGNLVPSANNLVTLALAANPSGSSLGGTLTGAAVNGIATFNNLTLNLAGTGYTLVARSTGLTSITSATFNVTPAAANALQFAQQPVGAVAGQAISPALTVQIVDAFGNLVTSATDSVTLTLGNNPGGGPLGGTTTVAAVNGVATFSSLFLTKSGTGYTLVAGRSGLTSAMSVAFTVTPAAASAVQFGQPPTGNVAGQVMSPAVTVRIVDAFDNLIADGSAPVTISLGANPGGSTLGGTTTVAAANGIATFDTLTLNRTGTGYTLVASSAGLMSVTSGTFTVTPAAASAVQFGQQPTTTAAGRVIAPPVTVQVVDAFGNVVTTSTATVTVGLKDNPGGATLGGTLAQAAVNGVATFSDLALDRAAAGYTLIAMSSGLNAATSAAFNITSGVATTLQFGQQPLSAVAGQPITPAVTVRIIDALGNLVANSNAPVTISLGANPGGSTLGGTLTVGAVNGLATFGNLTLNRSGTGYTLVASSAGLTAATSSPFDTAAAAASAVQFVQLPGNVTAGQSISPAVTVRIVDAFGNLVTTGSPMVTMTLGANPGGATLGGTTSVAAVNGIATFGNLTLDKAETGYTLVASSSGLTAATSGVFSVTAAAASAVQFVQQPTDITAGLSITPPVRVQVVDAFGNVVTASAATVTVALGANPGGSTLSGTTTVAAINGIATFPNLMLDQEGIGYTLVATSNGLTSATSSPFTVTPAPASTLQFVQQPTDLMAGDTITPPVTVQILNTLGELVTTATNRVTIALGANPVGSTLGGTLTAAAVGGVATFSDLSLDKVSNGYTLVATSNGLTSVVSSLFNVQPTYRATVTTDITSAPNGTPVPLRGQAINIVTGQPVPNRPVSIRILVNGTRRVLNVTTDANGNFSTAFQPLPNEAGRYAVAADHPAVTQDTIQASFTLVGMSATPGRLFPQLAPGTPLSGEIDLANLSDVPLTGLTATVINAPANVSAQLNVGPTLAANGTLKLNYTLTAQDASIRQAQLRFHLTSTEGAVFDIPVNLTVIPLTPQLAANPGSLQAGMVRGRQVVFPFQVTNIGGAPSGDLQVLLPSIPWLALASSATIPSLAPGQQTTVTLTLTPAADLPLDRYGGTIVLRGTRTGLVIPFQFRALSEAKGDLQVSVVDQYTYYADGAPKVAGAKVRLLDSFDNSIVIAQGTTDASGQVLLPNVREGTYLLEVNADKHDLYRASYRITPGILNVTEVFLARELINYRFVVAPTEIPDQYTVHLESTFETNVPVPLVKLKAPSTLPNLAPGEQTQIDLTLTNYGLIEAEDVQLRLPQIPDYTFTPLTDKLAVLPAKSSITIPVKMQRTAGGGGMGAGLNSCVAFFGAIFHLKCGKNGLWDTDLTMAN
jgi:hypothetical protein